MAQEEFDSVDDGGITDSLSEALGAIGTTTREAKTFSRGYLDRYNKGLDAEEQPTDRLLQQKREQAEQIKDVIRRARARVKERRYNPGEALLAVSAALSKPTRTGSLGETFGNVSEALIGPFARRRQYEDQQEDAISELDLAELNADNPVTNAEFTIAQLDKNLNSQMARAALRELGKSTTGSAGGAQRQQKIIAAFGQNLRAGMQPQEAMDRAVNVVDKNETVEVIPGIGLRGVNRLNRSSYELAPGAGVRATPQPIAGSDVPHQQYSSIDEAVLSGDTTLWDLASLGTGPGSALAQGWNLIGGMVGLPQASKVTQARQTLRNESNSMIRSLALNPRYPVGEIDRITEELSLKPEIIDNEGAMHDRMISLNEYLKRQLSIVEDGARDQELPDEQRQADRITARNIRNFLTIAGAPGDLPVPEGAPPEIAELWPNMNETEQRRTLELLQQMSQQE